jgi:murein L,D-transpeptidase YcbB/YkuD
MRTLTLIILFGLILPTTASAHPGNTDASGCHTCRTNCSKWGLSTGEYHCHRAKALPQPLEPIRSHNNGTTESWPEYKKAAPAVTTTPAAKKTNPAPVQKTTLAQIVKAAPKITYALAKGMENNQVLRLQQILAKYPEIYPEASVTGYFGTVTEKAVKRFQKKYGLEQTGTTGPKTRAILNAL